MVHWIDAAQQLPDTPRKVLVRGTTHYDEPILATAEWHEEDRKRWMNFTILSVGVITWGLQVTHWLDMDDLYCLPTLNRFEDNVHVEITDANLDELARLAQAAGDYNV